MKVTQHPLMEIIARKLSGIEGVPRSAQTRMVSAACHAARIYHDAEIERLRARVAELESTLDIHLKSATRTQQEIVEGNWERQ